MRSLYHSLSSRTLLSVRDLLLLLFIATFAVSVFAAAGDGEWLKNVPDKDRIRPNPLASDPDAVAGGAKLYKQHCSRCHGPDGQGVGGKPSLRSERVQGATPGELEWLLRNGSLKNGMPSWSGTPEPQRWQVVAYVKSLGKSAVTK
jgi:mono/diheme cytochrome c family protein